MRFSLIFTSFLLISTTLFSQSWKRMRNEVSGGIGFSNFLGDLGGGSQEGSYGPSDLNFQSSRWVINGAYRYYLRQNIALKGSLSFAQLSGSDEHSKEEVRKSRGLNFRTLIVELSGQFEYYFLTHRSRGTYRLKRSKGLKKLKLDAYVFGGIGMFYFNPKGELDGEWYALQPLGTEGQGAEGSGKEKYKRIEATFPIGIGFKRKIDKKFSIGFEMGLRMTTTDYIDDVSGKYYENDKIAAANPETVMVGDQEVNLAAYFANPPGPSEWADVAYNQDGTVSEFQQRGDPKNNDTYMFAVFSLHYKIIKRRRSLPKF